jgi:hypothetical protein
MADLRDPRWMYVKATLFLVGGLLSSAQVWMECPTLQVAVLLGVCVWCFARAYYFAFYVIERYVDPGFRFAGVIDFARYLLRKRGR